METVTLAEVNSLSSSTRKRNEVLYTTPTVQRIVNKDMKTPGASPTLRGGLNVRSPAIPPVNASVPLNDDEAEKRQRRLESRRKDFMSPGGHTPKNITSTADRRKQCSAGSQYSNAQIADHYKQCVKLSSENKINSKNAFGLHLIDYMADMLHRGGDMTNFQVAGCTLDASAKIYAGRVDSIYNDAYKMLGGLGRGSQGNEDGDDQEEADTEATDSGQQKKKKNTTRAVTVQTIERNTKSLDVVTFDLEFEVDPLYKKTSAAFDEGGIEGLLLNQIHPEDDLLSLKLDPSLGPSTVSTAPCGVAIQKMHLAAFVKEVDFVNRRICPTFGNFRFQIIEGNDDAWNLHNITDGKASLTPRSTFIEHESDNEPPEYQQDFSVAEVTENLSPEADIGPEDTTVHDAMHDGHQLLDFHMSADRVGESRNIYTLSDVLQESEYSYFKSDMLSTWAGPQFWKKKTVSQSLKQLTKSKKKEPKKVYRMDFSCSISESDFLPGKGSTQLSKSALSKMKLTTLPHDDKTEALSLLRLYHNPNWTVKQLSGSKGQLDTEDDAAGCYDYSNENDVKNFCPAFQFDVDGNDDDGACGESSILHETFVPFGNDTQLPEDDLSLSHPLAAAFVGDNLVAQPRKVQPLTIDYAKTAKKIDVKKVKSTIWSVITKHQENHETVEYPLTFTKMYEDVPSGLSDSTRRNLSIPICFVCLLHLANEKNLVITGVDDLSDVFVACEQ